MDSLIYEDSPLADILEGEAVPFEQPTFTPSKREQYAPRGYPRLQDPFRFIRSKARAVTHAAEERFLERFRYTIITSQLLAQDTEPRRRHEEDEANTSIPVSLRGVYLTAVCSFSVAWLLSWIRTRWNAPVQTTWSDIALFTAVAVTLILCLALTGQRQYLKYVRQTSFRAVTELSQQAASFDSTIHAALRYIQEIEVVARGYEISSPLPPVSRLEGPHVQRQCRDLRHQISGSLSAAVTRFLHFHDRLQTLVNADDLQNYYHINDLSTELFAETSMHAAEASTEPSEALRQLRFLVELHATARRFFAADLLAIRAIRSWTDIAKWRTVSQILQSITAENAQASHALQAALRREEEGSRSNESAFRDGNTVASPTELVTEHAEKQISKAQMRRLEALAHSIRALNLKAKLAQNQVAELIATDVEESELNAAFSTQYNLIGSDIRTLLVEWERGRNTMLLSADVDTRSSRPSSGPRSPISPSPSLGGITMVDGGPAEALRLLNGDGYSSSANTDAADEEVFEAVAKPRKRLSLALNREERMAKLQEDRKKRATLQEQQDTSTNMLRELQMVIKHRPTPSKPTNRVSSV